MVKKIKDNLGKKFGRLTIIKPHIGHRVVCECDCGETAYMNVYNVTNGFTKSCGCLQKERASEMNKERGNFA